MRKATVVGGRGFIGSHLVKKLTAEGVECFIPRHDDPELFERDLGDVFYCAGAPALSPQKGLDTQRAHAGLIAEILQNSRFDRLVYLSSTRVYMDAPHGDEGERLLVNPSNPDHLFNVTKLAGESLCLFTESETIRVARVSNVFGYGSRVQTFLPSLILSALREKRVVLKTGLQSAKDYISVDDCVDALVAICERGAERLYNVASGVNISHAQIVERLQELTGASVEVAPGAPTVGYPQIDVGRIRALIPAPRENVLDAMENLVRAYESEA